MMAFPRDVSHTGMRARPQLPGRRRRRRRYVFTRCACSCAEDGKKIPKSMSAELRPKIHVFMRYCCCCLSRDINNNRVYLSLDLSVAGGERGKQSNPTSGDRATSGVVV